MLVDKIKYRDYIIETNKFNVYKNKFFTYIFQHKDETDGKFDNAETIDECINKINELYDFM